MLRIPSKRSKILIFLTVRSKSMTAKDIRNHIKMPASVCTVRQAIKRQGILKYVTSRYASSISGNKQARIQFTERYQKQQTNGPKIIFSKGEYFNLDCLYSIHSYWRKEKYVLSMRQLGGSSIIVWSAFSSGRKFIIAFLEERRNLDTCIQML